MNIYEYVGHIVIIYVRYNCTGLPEINETLKTTIQSVFSVISSLQLGAVFSFANFI